MYINWNENSRLDLTLAIVDEGSFSIDSYYQNTGDRSFYNNHYYSDKAPGLSFLITPVYFVFREFFGSPTLHFNLFNQGVSQTWLWLVFLSIVFTSSLFGTLSIVLVYKTSKYFTKKELHRNLIVVVFGLATLVFVYSRILLDHVLSMFFCFLAFYLILKIKYDKPTFDYSFLIGLSLGFAVLISYSSVLFIPPIFLYFLFVSRSIKKLIILSLGIIVLLLPLFLYNYSITNSFVSPTNYVDPYIWNNLVDCKNTINTDEKEFCQSLMNNPDNCFKISNYSLADFCFFLL